MTRIFRATDPGGLHIDYENVPGAEYFPRTGLTQKLTVWDDRGDGSLPVYVAEFIRDDTPDHDHWVRYRPYEAWSAEDLDETPDSAL